MPKQNYYATIESRGGYKSDTVVFASNANTLESEVDSLLDALSDGGFDGSIIIDDGTSDNAVVIDCTEAAYTGMAKLREYLRPIMPDVCPACGQEPRVAERYTVDMRSPFRHISGGQFIIDDDEGEPVSGTFMHLGWEWACCNTGIVPHEHTRLIDTLREARDKQGYE